MDNYAIETKEKQLEPDASVAMRMQRLANEFETWGMRRTVEAVLLVHVHRHPHILVINIGDTHYKLYACSGKPGGLLNVLLSLGLAMSCSRARTRSLA